MRVLSPPFRFGREPYARALVPLANLGGTGLHRPMAVAIGLWGPGLPAKACLGHICARAKRTWAPKGTGKPILHPPRFMCFEGTSCNDRETRSYPSP